jgi:hypothetical protein
VPPHARSRPGGCRAASQERSVDDQDDAPPTKPSSTRQDSFVWWLTTPAAAGLVERQLHARVSTAAQVLETDDLAELCALLHASHAGVLRRQLEQTARYLWLVWRGEQEATERGVAPIAVCLSGCTLARRWPRRDRDFHIVKYSTNTNARSSEERAFIKWILSQ